MKKNKILLGVLAILTLGAFWAPAAFAGEGCDDAGEMEQLCKMLKEWADKTIGDGDFVASCLGFAEAPGLCDAADIAGTGLVCPDGGEPATVNHDCQVLDSSSFEASFGLKSGQVLKLAGEFSVRFVMIGEENSVPTHNHQQTCEATGSCAEEYIKRQEKVTVFFAAAQKGKLSTDPLENFEQLGTFKAALEGKKVTYFQVSNHHYCTKVDHGDPRSCRKPPTTPGGTTCTGGEGTCEETEPRPTECTDSVSTDGDVVIIEH